MLLGYTRRGRPIPVAARDTTPQTSLDGENYRRLDLGHKRSSKGSQGGERTSKSEDREALIGNIQSLARL